MWAFYLVDRQDTQLIFWAFSTYSRWRVSVQGCCSVHPTLGSPRSSIWASPQLSGYRPYPSVCADTHFSECSRWTLSLDGVGLSAVPRISNFTRVWPCYCEPCQIVHLCREAFFSVSEESLQLLLINGSLYLSHARLGASKIFVVGLSVCGCFLYIFHVSFPLLRGSTAFNTVVALYSAVYSGAFTNSV